MISNDEFSKIFSRNLRRIMYEREISQSKMAQDLNIPKTTISGWVNAKRTPKMDKNRFDGAARKQFKPDCERSKNTGIMKSRRRYPD